VSPDKKIKISLVILGAIVLAFVIFLIYPLISGIQKEAAELMAQKNNLAELETKIENLENFKATHKVYQPNFDKLESLLIDPREPLGFIEFLEEESANSQVLIEIAPLSPNTMKDDPWPSMNFHLALTGSFPHFLNFFEKLELSPYLVEVLSLHVRHLTESEILAKKLDNLSIQDINAALSIKVYTK